MLPSLAVRCAQLTLKWALSCPNTANIVFLSSVSRSKAQALLVFQRMPATSNQRPCVPILRSLSLPAIILPKDTGHLKQLTKNSPTGYSHQLSPSETNTRYSIHNDLKNFEAISILQKMMKTEICLLKNSHKLKFSLIPKICYFKLVSFKSNK